MINRARAVHKTAGGPIEKMKEEPSMKKARLFALLVCIAMLLTAFPATVLAENELTYQGTITMYAQALTPVEQSETNPRAITGFKTVAEQWEAMHPGITIEFLDQVASGTDYLTWLKTKMAGAQAPDIFWQHASNINGGAIPQGANIDLGEALQMPNKYVEGNEHWIDLFPASVNAANVGPNGEQPVINADYVGTAVYYNVELFEKAGIETPGAQVTWAQYCDICDQLKAAGITPWAFSFGNNQDDTAYINWWTRLFNTNFYYNDFADLAVINPDKATLTAAEVMIAFKNGYFGVDNDKWLAWWPIMKEQVDKYMPADAISAASTRDTIQTQFLSGDIAMIWEGSWAPNNFAAANVSFEVGSFPFPYMTQESSEYATDAFVSGCVGGPYAAFQYAVSSPKANSTMTDEKFEAIIDWLMFATTPENDSLICNDNGAFIPTVIGSTPSEANAGLVALLQADDHVIDDGMVTLNGTAFADLYYRTFQQFLRGDLTMEEVKETLRDDLEETIDEYIEDHDLEDVIAEYVK